MSGGLGAGCLDESSSYTNSQTWEGPSLDCRYRPISLTGVGKTMERVVNRRLVWVLEN